MNQIERWAVRIRDNQVMERLKIYEWKGNKKKSGYPVSRDERILIFLTMQREYTSASRLLYIHRPYHGQEKERSRYFFTRRICNATTFLTTPRAAKATDWNSKVFLFKALSAPQNVEILYVWFSLTDKAAQQQVKSNPLQIKASYVLCGRITVVSTCMMFIGSNILGRVLGHIGKTLIDLTRR